MAEVELKDNAVLIVVLLTLGVAIASMLFFIRSEKGEDVEQGRPFVVRKPSPPAATPAAAPSEAPAREADPPSQLPVGAVFGAIASRPAPAREPESGLVAAEAPARTAARPAPSAGPPAGFREMVMVERKKMRAVWDRHLAKSPALKAYVKEWNETPELAALKDRWHRDYDPVAFLKGLAGEPKFFQLLGKYAKSPELVAIIREDVAGASPAALQAVNKTMTSDGTIRQLLDKVSSSVGFPLGSLLGGGKGADPQEMLKAVMQQHPVLDPKGKR